MNFDEIKNSWDAEKATDVTIPSALNTLRKAKHPIDKLRTNMKNEFFMQIVAVLIIPFFLKVSADMRMLFISSYILFVAISAYYLYYFYRFYKDMHNYSMETKDGLQELYYQLRLNMERYKSFGFLLLPFIFIFLGFIEFGNVKNGRLNLTILLNRHAWLFTGLIAFIAVSYIFIIVAWVKSFYGKYALQIKGVLDELKEETTR
ncbi:MAG: hypothetical protein H7Y86_20005 [Rhizobacter sp.]|nr:hypothetical protein [Ferruginibacter sp.]